MPSQRGVDGCLQWIKDEREVLSDADMGSNMTTVQLAIEDQAKRNTAIRQYREQIGNAVAENDATESEYAKLHAQYVALTVGYRRQENPLSRNTVKSFKFRRVLFGQINTDKPKHLNGAPVGDSLSTTYAAQDCIFAVRNNWAWIQTVAKCMDTHLANAAAYHQFYHEVEECDYWMNLCLATLYKKFADRDMEGDRQSAMRMLKELGETLQAYLQWQARVDDLYDKSKDIVPVKMRTQALKDPKPVRALCAYKANGVQIQDGEDLTLLDNTDPTKWKVKTKKGPELFIPAVCVLIPPMDVDAVEAATRLRLQLLAIWTQCVKRLGKQMITLMQLVFRDWSTEEPFSTEERQQIALLRSLPNGKKDMLLKIMALIEETLGKHWKDYPQFEELLERFGRLRIILRQEPVVDIEDEAVVTTIVVQIGTLEDLMRKYEDFWIYWQTYKVILETLRQPHFMLIVDKWEQLRFISTAHFVKFWQTEITVDDIEKSEEISVIHETPKQSLKPVDVLDADLSLSTEERKAETQQYVESEQEEQRKFIIKGVTDPVSGNVISMQQAIGMGVINQETGCYVNKVTGDSMPIPQAMNEGLIQVEFATAKRSKEKKKSIGVITIKTERQNKPYSIVGAVNPKTGAEISVAVALEQGLLNESRGVYVHPVTKQEMTLSDAIDAGLLLVKFDENVEADVTTKTYAIHAVVDQRRKARVSFQEAVDHGLLDRDTGSYVNNVTGEKIYVADAIMRGFVKAHEVDDPSKLDIDAENKIVVEKMENMKKKLLKPMKALNAFRSAVKASKVPNGSVSAKK
ncbi:microtubule-actin cross-linking factor 1, isoforms 1/2/3/5 [Lingula anatina]|uniref:Microtubule-actin cross-linking factor 1, isoforms 1/2/3/5 n=1 Tax=Lingula anatina TaxID=7574 RepID=A0A1S3J4V5_LINAN|nr:microtubule-actin cross-linking factor 1, isoforms 1/2/3/5 [Lingula anatina]|eukprot:XP_013405313.1 microtubule-actin cross-linking factor 1, isoforms 1/2/3/5 [Lingula anatina]